MAAARSSKDPSISLHLSLVEDLATGDVVSSGLVLLLTEEQSLLQISPHFIFLAGLAILAAAGQDTTTELQYFQDYCCHYNDCQSSLTRKTKLAILPVLSPRVRPTETQLNAIKQQVAMKAQTSLEALLELEAEEEKVSMQTKKKKPNQRNKNKATSSINNRGNNIIANEQKEHNSTSIPTTDSLETLIHTKLHIVETRTLQFEEEEENEQDWVPILPPKPKKTAARDFPPVIQEPRPITNQKSSDSHPVVLQKADLIATDDDNVLATMALNVNSEERKNHATTTKNHSKQQPIHSVVKHSLPSPTANASDADTAIPTSDIDGKDTRIAHLTAALKEAHAKIQRQEESHRQQLSQQQEGHANSIQALQLRLYIAETQLKAHQDALEQHITSVASHTSSSGSPRRRSHHAAAPAESDVESSPLLSRVLAHHSALKE